MGPSSAGFNDYFVFGFPLSDKAWQRYDVTTVLPGDLAGDLDEPAWEIRKLAERITRQPHPEQSPPPPAEILLALRTVNQALRWLTEQYFLHDNPGALQRGRQWTGQKLGDAAVSDLTSKFVDMFPPLAIQMAATDPDAFLREMAANLSGADQATLEMILLFLNGTNPATRPARELFDDADLRREASFVPFVTGLEDFLETCEPA